ncbi:MAG: 30S ribosome-binding factor RbfA [Anaerolineae bacterium]|nr:30S ribosome-binding factor RbfA [Anaerolineae bacterium]
MPYRTERAEVFILEELTRLLMHDVHDPRVAPITVTDVDLTRDRRIARVYVACYSGEEDLRAGLAGLESAKGFLRHGLSQVLHWRFTPEIEFRVDRSWEYGNKIEALLEAIHEEDDEGTDEGSEPVDEQL